MELEEGDPWHAAFFLSFDLDERLSPREHAILTNSAKSCEVSRMLNGTTTVVIQKDNRN